VLTYLAIGIVIGVVTCIPIGVANVAVIDAAYRHNVMRALAVGLGGAVADGIYSSLGILGIGPLLDDYPDVPPILYGVSGVVLIVYGFTVARSQPFAQPETVSRAPTTAGQHLAAGFILGVLVTMLNPSAVITWVVIVGSYAAGVSLTDGIAWVAGIVVGSFVWFCVVAYLADHGKRMLSGRAVWITRVVGWLVLGYGVFSLVRAGQYFLPRI
jgi:arginine exporter protein ArgO